MAQLNDVRVLVTGATSGLGRAMAAALTAAGARRRDHQPRRGAGGGCRLRPRPGAFGLALDVRDESSVRAGVDQVYERLGGLDLLVATQGSGCGPSTRAS